ncbi:MAG: protein kinase, partial [Planctomycetota bacterium]|nr:protein kinase [Planctomycetota bacterium]
MSDPSCQNCGAVAKLENGLCFNCRLLQAGSQETMKEETSFEGLQNPRLISPDDLVRRVAGGLKEPNSDSFQETFQSPDISDHTPAPVPSTVETARRERPESVSGKFTMVEKVGTGGAGEVWKAWDESIHRWVALKFLKNEEEFNLQLFRREARMVGRLSHPHIIPIHEMGILGKHHYIAMKFVEGATLREYVRQDVG